MFDSKQLRRDVRHAVAALAGASWLIYPGPQAHHDPQTFRAGVGLITIDAQLTPSRAAVAMPRALTAADIA